MKSNLEEDQITDFYLKVANGNSDALEFLNLWASYAHKLDDLVDEEFNVVSLIDSNLDLARLTTTRFFTLHAPLLLAQIYLAAESYQASETLNKGTWLGIMLSHEGNNMLRVVALITGGFKHLEMVSSKLRELTFIEHPLEESNNFEVTPINN
jgi:hypothetical protein